MAERATGVEPLPSSPVTLPLRSPDKCLAVLQGSGRCPSQRRKAHLMIARPRETRTKKFCGLASSSFVRHIACPIREESEASMAVRAEVIPALTRGDARRGIGARTGLVAVTVEKPLFGWFPKLSLHRQLSRALAARFAPGKLMIAKCVCLSVDLG